MRSDISPPCKSSYNGHLIQKLRVKCSVTYLFCTRPHIFTGFLLYVSFSELFCRNKYFGHLIQIFRKLLSHVRICTLRYFFSYFLIIHLTYRTFTVPEVEIVWVRGQGILPCRRLRLCWQGQVVLPRRRLRLYNVSLSCIDKTNMK